MITHKEFVDILVRATREYEVRKAYILRFNLPTTTRFKTDLSFQNLLIEFKLDRDFTKPKQLAKTIAQILYYYKLHKKYRKSTNPPKYWMAANRQHAIYGKLEDFEGWLRNPMYNWKLPPSNPDPVLVEELSKHEKLQKLKLFNIIDFNEAKIFAGLLRLCILEQL